MKSQANTTPKQFKYGHVRDDGKVFIRYTKRKTKGGDIGVESWGSAEHHHRSRISHILINTKRRAKEQNIPCNLDMDFLIDLYPNDGMCPALNVKLEWGEANGRKYSPSLDRIIPEKGYVKGNVVFVSWKANTTKSDLTIDQLRSLVTFYESLNERQTTH